jgi:hypothetical protein
MPYIAATAVAVSKSELIYNASIVAVSTLSCIKANANLHHSANLTFMIFTQKPTNIQLLHIF